MNFKVGDIVIPFKNSSWKMPLAIVEVRHDIVIVNHPRRGRGGFGFDEIVHANIYNSPLWKAMQ